MRPRTRPIATGSSFPPFPTCHKSAILLILRCWREFHRERCVKNAGFTHLPGYSRS